MLASQCYPSIVARELEVWHVWRCAMWMTVDCTQEMEDIYVAFALQVHIDCCGVWELQQAVDIA